MEGDPRAPRASGAADRGREPVPWVSGLGSALVEAAQNAAPAQASPRLPTDAEVLAGVLDLSPAGVVLLDAEGAVVSANRRAREILGTRADLGPADPFGGRDSPFVAVARAGRPLQRHLHVFARPDGTQAVLSLDSSPLGAFHLAVFEDVTARTDSTLAAQTSERRYRDLFERMIDGFALHEILLDADGRPADYRFLDVNPAFERMTGLRREEILGRTVLEVLPNVERSWIDIYGEVALTGESVRFENYAGALGRYFDVVAFAPARGRFATIFIETTDRVLAERKLRESEERLRAVVDHMPVMLHAVDEGGRIAFWNRESERVSGYSAEEIGADPEALERVYPAAGSRKAILGEPPAGGRPACDVELRRRDGEARTVVWTELSRRAPIPGWHRWGIGMDVTEHRQLEDQFRHAQKMEAVGRLAGGVAHDFNNLLTAILGYCDLLEMRMESDNPRLKEIREIQAIAARSGLLTQQLLAFSRKQSPHVETLDLNEALRDLEGMLGRLLGEDVALCLDLAEGPALVRIDPTQLQQVVVNLAVNARDAMPGGGRLVLSTVAAGGRIVLNVVDTGAGMEPEIASRIFEPFFTTKDSGHGTGLGLSTVHGIVHQGGGSIEVESAPGQGTTFRLSLPRADEAPRAPEAPPKEPGSARGRETLLVVEDSEGVLDLVREILEARGFRVLAAATAEEALRVAEGHAGPIDLLLTDLVLPGMSGAALAARLGQARPDVRVLYMSGYAEGALTAPPGEPAPFLQKPFRPDALAEAVRTALDV